MLTLQCLKCGKVLRAKTKERLRFLLHTHLTKRYGCVPKEVKQNVI